MTSSVERAKRFVELHRGDDLFVMANPANVGTAKMLEDLGYPALGTSSGALAHSLGRPDAAGAIGRDEAIAHAVEIAAATTVPISGDFENGFGHRPEDVAETVRTAIAVGLAGCCIEDATGDADDPLYGADAATERIRAGVEAVGDSPFVLVARAENFLYGRPDIADTIARLQAFEAAGADVAYAPGLTTLDDIRAVVESVSIPVNVLVSSPRQLFTLHDLAALGVRRVSVGAAFLREANRRFADCAEALLDRDRPIASIFG